MALTAPEPLVLVGDIGGTNLSLALARVSAEGVRCLHTATRPSAGAQGVEAAVKAFLRDTHALGRPQAACFAAAGPLRQDRIELTNLPWSLDRRALAQRLDLPVALLNDTGALVHAAVRLAPEDPRVVDLGGPPTSDSAGPLVVVGVGTGLGVGYGFWQGDRPCVFPSEGGHVGLPVFDEASEALHAELSATGSGRPDAEAVVSGPGLARILAFFVDSERAPRTPLTEAILTAPLADRPRLVLEGASSDLACARTLSHFLATYARVCADLALAFLPTGGLYLAGGLTARLAPHLRPPESFQIPFQRASRPHAAALLQALPLRLLTDYALSLEGAAWVAADLAAASSE